MILGGLGFGRGLGLKVGLILRRLRIAELDELEATWLELADDSES